ncbi:MAG TPA: choice-of-anchor Q domain-containing protein, partial [Burkholderiales bacterium]|nr:choice-of-anchor Q domain-containing protein [Burkholderiales bacterium]
GTVSRMNQGRTVPGITINQTDPCDGGVGSIRTTGTLSDVDGTGTVAVDFIGCLLDGNTVNGQATIRVSMVNLAIQLPTDFTTSFSRLTIRGAGVSTDAGGSLRVQADLATSTETITENMVLLDNLTGQMTKSENLRFVNTYDNLFFPSFFTATVSGRIYDSVHGFVDVNTLMPILFPNVNQIFPSGGQVLLRGSGNRAVRVTALSSTTATFALDLNGDSVFERSVTLQWADLSGPVGADLADNDGDGMHNSWETANGLNPNNAADAALDKDGDGASNLAEYQAGTDPSNPNSTPPVVGLSLSVQDTPDPVVVGGNLSYTIVVTNSSPNAASNVVLTNTLPASVTLTSPLQPTLGSCSGTTTITCNFGTIGAFLTASVVIGVTPTAEGLVSNSASITTSSFDPNTSDNTATNLTTVGQPLTGIQTQINNAIDGDTIIVDPGFYFGGLVFSGKNVTLQSRDGPATTIISGSQAPAAQIGPLGGIKGFTITGGGVQVVGQGTVISGNIFDNNVQVSAIGIAIGGNNGSPTIERNIFRNTSCGNPSSVGVIEFVNNSSPLIVNNIFENNPCQAISFTLPSGNAPQVINNTFVGNRAGIKIWRGTSQVTQVFRNNVIVQGALGWEVLVLQGTTDADNPVWQNNLVFGNTMANYQGTADLTNTNGNISANPMFVNGAAGNYRLQAGSPAIDAGNPVGAPNLDFDGVSRPLDGDGNGSNIWDIGAFEAP